MIGADSVVLVTGATGFTGRYLVDALMQSGCELRAICRPSANIERLQQQGVCCYRGNVYDPEVIAEACRGVTHVFHLAAAYRQSGIADEEYFLTHVRSTQLLAAAFAESSTLKKFIHVSTVGVLGHIDHPPANELTPYGPGDLYQSSKTEAEQWVLKNFPLMNIPFAVVRPAAIYGPGDKRLLKLFKMAKLPLIPIIGSTQGLYHLIHVEDLVRFMIHLCQQPQHENPVFICGSQKPTSIRQMTAVIAHTLGRKPIYIRIPSWPIFLLADLCELVCRKLGVEPPIYRRRVAFFTKDRAFDTRKMTQVAHFEPSISDTDGLEQLTNWYLRQGWL